MSDDWKPGDLALCVRANPLGWDATIPGAVYTVERLGRGFHSLTGKIDLGLHLKEAPHPGAGSSATRFRKIRPHTPDEQDAETIRLLNGAPVKEPIHA